MRIMRRIILLLAIAACGYRAPDSIVSASLDTTTPWTLHTMYGPADPTETNVGADGMDGNADRGASLVDWVSGFEESARVIATFHPGYPAVQTATVWPKVVMTATVSGVEDAIWADGDGDGKRDILAAGSSGFEMHWFFGPGAGSADETNPSKWTHVPILASLKNPDGSNIGSRWLRAGFADVNGDGIPDVVACGYSTGALLAYWTSPTPRISTSYVMHVIGHVGACQEMQLVDVDHDGRIDVVISDRDTWFLSGVPQYGQRGVGWFRNNGDGTWTYARIVPEPPVKARWHCETADLGVIVEGFADEQSPNVNHLQLWTRAIDGAPSWTLTANLDPGTDVGWYQSCAIGDLRNIGRADIVLSYSHADSALNPGEGDQGVVAMLDNGDGTYQRATVSGTAGCKYDNTRLVDVNGDGRKDIVQSEQGCSGGTTPKSQRKGMIWFENPYAPSGGE